MVSVVVVNWNSGTLLERCVRSLFENAPETTVVIVDNASTDSSLHFARELPAARVSILRNSRNLGFAAASNLGWRSSSGARVLFLNPDAEACPGSVQRLDETFDDPGIWAVGGRLVSPSGEAQPGFNVRAFPTVGRVAAEMLLLDELWPRHPWSQPRLENGAAGPMDVDQPAAACLMVSREALEALGGFDENFHPAWFEDVDLCRRIHDRGARILFQPAARFLHHGGYSLGRLSRREFLEFYHSNQIRYFRKHHGPRSAARVRLLVAAGLLIRGALSLVPRPAAARDFWQASRTVLRMREAGR